MTMSDPRLGMVAGEPSGLVVATVEMPLVPVHRQLAAPRSEISVP